MKHYPKGGMCASCKHRNRDCSHLNFAAMRVIERHAEDVWIVRCTDWQRREVDE